MHVSLRWCLLTWPERMLLIYLLLQFSCDLWCVLICRLCTCRIFKSFSTLYIGTLYIILSPCIGGHKRFSPHIVFGKLLCSESTYGVQAVSCHVVTSYSRTLSVASSSVTFFYMYIWLAILLFVYKPISIRFGSVKSKPQIRVTVQCASLETTSPQLPISDQAMVFLIVVLSVEPMEFCGLSGKCVWWLLMTLVLWQQKSRNGPCGPCSIAMSNDQRLSLPIWGFPARHGGTPKWMVYFRENPI